MGASLMLRGQNGLSDSLLFYEYACFKSTDTTAQQQFLLKKLNLYLNRGLTGPEMFREAKRVQIKFLGTHKSDFLWNAAVLGYLNNETDRAAFYLSEYGEQAGDTGIAYNLLSVLINKYSDTAQVRRSINFLEKKDSLFNGLHCFAEVAAYERKHLNFYRISSAIVPGSGTMINGAVLKGIISLALTAGSVYGIVQLVKYGLYLNAFFWGTGVGLKFYAGNLKLTEKTFYQKEQRQKNKPATECGLKLQKILNKYPLTLKAL